MGNEARFINDYRGAATKPNAVFVDERSVAGELQMTVWSCDQEIKKGDEILVSYGKGWWMARSGESAVDKLGFNGANEDNGGAKGHST